MLRILMNCLAVVLVASPALAQAPADPTPEGLGVEVVPGDALKVIQIAVPPAINMGGAADTRGITEATSATISRALSITGYFNLIDPAAYLVDPTKEGMDTTFTDWFNAGAQGLVKVGYRIEGNDVVVDLRLYHIDKTKRVTLPAPYDQPQRLPITGGKLRGHAHGFVNQVIKYFTNTEGFFGTFIVFVKRTKNGKEIFMMSPDGTGETALTNAGGINMLPSMGGGKVYFTSFRNGGAHLFTLSGGAAKPFASYTGMNSGAVPGPGGQVAATLSKDGNPEIYLLDSGGGVSKRLTDSWGIDTSPAWSPDGAQLAFVSDRHGSPQIWVMSSSGGNQRRITFQGDYNQTPDWSPRGDKIVFTARDERNVFDIFTVEVGSGEVARLTQNQGNNEEPTWSPDGRFIAFTSTRSGESKMYLMSEDGRTQTQISTGRGSYLTPSWAR